MSGEPQTIGEERFKALLSPDMQRIRALREERGFSSAGAWSLARREAFGRAIDEASTVEDLKFILKAMLRGLHL